MEMTLNIKEPDVLAIIDLLGQLDDYTEELRIRQQEIFSYDEKENTLQLQLAQAQASGQIIKIIRRYVRTLGTELLLKAASENNGGKDNDKKQG